MAVTREKKLHISKKVATPEVFQMEAVECGAACLLMILKYYKCFLPLEEVREACAVSRNGCNAANIVMAASRYGLEGKGYSCELDRLYEIQKPCIIHWNFKHFVVLESIDKKYARINDPASGHRRISIEELDEAFTGIVLSFVPGPDFKPGGKEQSIASALFGMLRGEGRGAWFLIFSGLGLVFAGLLCPILMQIFVDDVLTGLDMRWLTILLVGMFMVFFSQSILSYLKSGVLTRLKIKLTLREDAFLISKLLRLPAAFFEQRFAGELSQREETINRLYAFASGALSDMILNLFQAGFYLILMFLYSPLLTFLALAGVAVSIISFQYSMHILRGYALKQTQDRNRMMGLLCSGISVFGSVKAAGAENDIVSLLSRHYTASTQSAQRLAVAQQIISAIPNTIAQIMNVVVLMVGSSLVMRGKITAGILFAFCQFLGLLLAPVMSMLSMQQQIQTLRADLSVLEDAMESKEDFRFTGENKAPEDELLSGRVEADGLTFGYDPGEPPLVKGFSFKMMPGSTVAIVGASGSGKSTVGKLISGLLMSWQGRVLYDGTPVTQLNRDVLSHCVSVAAQKEAFFAASIRDNLTLWDNRYTDQEILRALSDADALEMVNSLSGGIDHMLQEGAGNLSGGQRQQLSIARALLSDPAVMILDEATSAMDALRERVVMENLRRRNCSLIIIAHRLSSVIHADLIIVMSDGKIVEAGKHESLIEANGIYAGLYNTDMGKEQRTA